MDNTIRETQSSIDSLIRWHGEYADGNHYGYIKDVLFYTVAKESSDAYIASGLPSPVPHVADSLESAKSACDTNFKAFLAQSGLAVQP